METNVLLTRKAISELQRLDHHEQEKARCVLWSLVDGKPSSKAKLKGSENLERARKGIIRVLYCERKKSILVLRVARRPEAYLGPLPEAGDDLFDKAVNWFEYQDAFFSKIHEPETLYEPIYESHAADGESWRSFLNGDYRQSPVLDREQEDEFSHFIRAANDSTCIVACQAGPGTGKTVTAVLSAASALSEKPDAAVYVILPERLIEEVKNYPRIKDALRYQEQLQICTISDLMNRLLPSINCASPAQELDCFRTDKRKHQSLDYQQLISLQAYQMDPDHESGSTKDTILKEHRKLTAGVSTQEFRASLRRHNLLCRWDAASKACEKIAGLKLNSKRNLFFVDEVQDLLRMEIRLLIRLVRHLNKDGHRASLWFFGDSNQRVSPSNFSWNWLTETEKVCRKTPFRRNYRNSKAIASFASHVLDLADVRGGRHLDQRANPDDCVMDGPPVKLLELPNARSAEAFLASLGTSQDEDYFMNWSTKATKVLWPGDHVLAGHKPDNIVCLDVYRAKGSETEACLAYRFFNEKDSYTVDRCQRLYTAFTRARSRLLLVETSEDVGNIPGSLRELCEFMGPEETRTAMKSLLEESGDYDVTRTGDETTRHLVHRCRTKGIPFFDADRVAVKAGIDLIDLMVEMLTGCFKAWDEGIRPDPGKSLDEESFARLFVLAAGGDLQETEKAAQAYTHRSDGFESGKAFLEAIARYLETHAGRPIEAARLRFRNGLEEKRFECPFPEIITDPGHLYHSTLNAIRKRLAFMEEGFG